MTVLRCTEQTVLLEVEDAVRSTSDVTGRMLCAAQFFHHIIFGSHVLTWNVFYPIIECLCDANSC